LIEDFHRSIHRYINLAIRAGMMDAGRNPYLLFEKRKEAEPERVFLNEMELQRLEELELPADCPLDRTRLLFLLSSYCGLRYSDLVQLAPCHLEETREGMVVRMRMKKTEDLIYLPLWGLFRRPGEPMSRPEAILRAAMAKRGRAMDKEAFREIPFFKIRNQNYNRNLKRLAQRAGITKHLTTHVARRTFATLMASKVSVPTLQRLLGHRQIETTMLYVNLSAHAIDEELRKTNW